MIETLRPDELARQLGISVRTVMRAIRAGELRASQLARRGCWRIEPDDVAAWLELRANRPRERPMEPPSPILAAALDSARAPKRGARTHPTGRLRVPPTARKDAA